MPLGPQHRFRKINGYVEVGDPFTKAMANPGGDKRKQRRHGRERRVGAQPRDVVHRPADGRSRQHGGQIARGVCAWPGSSAPASAPSRVDSK